MKKVLIIIAVVLLSSCSNMVRTYYVKMYAGDSLLKVVKVEMLIPAKFDNCITYFEKGQHHVFCGTYIAEQISNEDYNPLDTMSKDEKIKYLLDKRKNAKRGEEWK